MSIKLSNPTQNNQSTIPILSTHQQYLKDLLQLVILTPNVDNAMFLLYSDDDSEPKNLLASYKVKATEYSLKFGLFWAETLINGQDTIIIGMNKSYLDFMKLDEKLTDKHLNLLYLFRKFINIKFCFCFDKNIIVDSAFRQVKNSFDKLAFIINTSQLKDWGKGFMILIYHNGDNNIVKDTKLKLQKSIKEKNFYKQNHKFVEGIVHGVVNGNKIIQCSKKLTQKEICKKQADFQKMISQLLPLSQKHERKGLPISERFMNSLEQKSSKWKILPSSSSSSMEQTLRNTGQKKQKQSEISLIFCIWEDSFSKLLQYIADKQGKKPQSIASLRQLFKLLPQNVSQKYVLKLNQLGDCQSPILSRLSQQGQGRSSAGRTQSFMSARLLAKALSKLTKIVDEKQIFNNNSKDTKEGEVLAYIQKSIKEFIRLFYECGILDMKEEKIVYDYFMVFYELVELWYPIRSVQNKFSFFQMNDLMKQYLPDREKVKLLVNNLSQMLVYQVQVDLRKYKDGSLVRLQQLQIPLQKIKEQINEPFIKKIISQRLYSTIEMYELQFSKYKIKQLSNKPYQKILYVMELLQSQHNNLLERKELLAELVNSCKEYIEEYKITTRELKLKGAMIGLLEMARSEEQSVISMYEDECIQMFKTCRKQSTTLTPQQKQFIQAYLEYLIKLGYLETARQRAHLISQFDPKLSKQLLVRCLLKTNAKIQYEHIISSDQALTQSKKASKVEEGKKILATIRDYFQLDVKNVREEKKREEVELIDI